MWLFSCLSCVRFFCDPTDCSPPDSSFHGISQARTLEWVAISFCRGSVFLIQGLNSHLLHWQVDSLPLSHLGSPVSTVYYVVLTSWGKSSKHDRNSWAQEKWSAFKILSGIWAKKKWECRQPTPNLSQAQFTQWLLETLFSLSPLISFWIPSYGRRICIKIVYIIMIIIYIRILVQYYKLLYIYWDNICVQPNEAFARISRFTKINISSIPQVINRKMTIFKKFWNIWYVYFTIASGS